MKINQAKQLAEQGDASAQYDLAYMYEMGHYTDKDIKKAIYWYTKSANQGFAEAQYYLGCLNLAGFGMEKNIPLALQWFTKAAEQDHPVAQFTLGALYHDGNDVKQNYQKSLFWYQQAAEQGYGKAQENLAYMAAGGEGMEVNIPMAIKWYREAAQQGLAESQYNLAIYHIRGEWLKRDLTWARYWLKKAVKNGLEQAKYTLASLDELEQDEERESQRHEKASLEKIFSEEEAMSCFCIAADIIKQNGLPLMPPVIFMFSDNEEFLIYKDLMMYSIYLLGMKSDYNWTQIYDEAVKPDNLTKAVKHLSRFSESKKKYASAFLYKIVEDDADIEHRSVRYSQYNLYCQKCGIRSVFGEGLEDLLCYKMCKMNGRDSIPAPDYITLDVDGLEFDMVRVEGGTFIMGNDDPGTSEDGFSTIDNPTHKVTVDPFYIGDSVVTEKLWAKVMGGSTKDDNDVPKCASWYECQEFIEKLSKLLDLSFRLPTEAEWEFAARGGNESEGYQYSGSDEIDDVGYVDFNSDGELHEISQKYMNELGIYDMSGNIFEWCSDWVDANYYYCSPVDNPQGPAEGTEKVIRGGSFSLDEFFSRVEIRCAMDPNNKNLVGLRLVMVI